jgi:hypothetical protein
MFYCTVVEARSKGVATEQHLAVVAAIVAVNVNGKSGQATTYASGSYSVSTCQLSADLFALRWS